MGMYIFVNKDDIQRMSQVNSDQELNELFQEARQYDKSILIEEKLHQRVRGVFSRYKEQYFKYPLYHESPSSDGAPYQARLMVSASTNKQSVSAYLYGIINGAEHLSRNIEQKYHKRVQEQDKNNLENLKILYYAPVEGAQWRKFPHDMTLSDFKNLLASGKFPIVLCTAFVPDFDMHISQNSWDVLGTAVSGIMLEDATTIRIPKEQEGFSQKGILIEGKNPYSTREEVFERIENNIRKLK